MGAVPNDPRLPSVKPSAWAWGDGRIRLFQIYGLGEGDYTRGRHKCLGNTSVEEIAAKIGIPEKRQ